MSIGTNFSNTFSLLNDRALTLINTMERSIRNETDQAQRSVLALADLYERGEVATGPLSPDKYQSQLAILQAIMITSPVVEALLIYNDQGSHHGIYRTPGGDFGPVPFALDKQGQFNAAFAKFPLSNAKAPIWGEPIIRDKTLIHNVGYPLMSEGKLSGYVVATIGQRNLNRLITSLGTDNETTAFVLTDDEKVIAHSRLPKLFKERGSIPLDEFPDQSLKQFADAHKVKRPADHDSQNMDVFESGRRTGILFITRKLSGYSSIPYRLGAYFPKAELSDEITRAVNSAIAGFVALILAIIASIFLARHLSRPMYKISGVANDFCNLELGDFSQLPNSRIREIDEQSNAMNSMHTALSEFSHYVPRALVQRLMAPGSEAIRSVEREITIMFTDIVAFTTMSEGLNAVDTASLLNSHFDIVCHQIGKNNGTVDKFIGDGLMAFWGAPDADNSQASNALNAANDILGAVKQQNELRISQGLDPLRMRIGIHTGRVVVGNIGSSERHNYTLVGDAVNVANRLEQFGKLHLGDADAVLMISGATWRAAGEPASFYPQGFQKLRGREALVEIYSMGGNRENKDGSQNIDIVSSNRRDAG